MTKFGPWKVWCEGGGMWIRPVIGSKSLVERPRLEVAVPADDVERLVVDQVVLVAVADADLQPEFAALAIGLELVGGWMSRW
jgi:hypothetical protein